MAIRNKTNKRNKINRRNKINKHNKKHTRKTRASNKRRKYGGIVNFDSFGNTISIPRTVNDKYDIMPFWDSFFYSKKNLNDFKLFILKTLYKIRYENMDICTDIKSAIPTFKVTDKYGISIKMLMCFTTLLISFISSIIKDKYTLLVKGGRAIQLALSQNIRYDPLTNTEIESITYENEYLSDDIDIIVIPTFKGSETLTKPILFKNSQNAALRIGELIEWLTNDGRYSTYALKHFIRDKMTEGVTMDLSPENLSQSSIIKVSIPYSKPSFIAVSDIGYITSEYVDIFNSNPITTNINIDSKNSGLLVSMNLQGLILEKIFYLTKYISEGYKNDSNLNKFRESLRKSLPFLLNDLVTNIMNKAKTSDDIEYRKKLYESIKYLSSSSNENIINQYGELNIPESAESESGLETDIIDINETLVKRCLLKYYFYALLNELQMAGMVGMGKTLFGVGFEQLIGQI